MRAPLLRKLSFGLLGLVAIGGFAGCQCNGAPRTAKAPRGGNQTAAYAQEDLILDRLDRMQLEMDARFSGLQSDVNDLRNRPAPAPTVEYIAPPQQVVQPPAMQTIEYTIPADTTFVELPQMQPVVQRRSSLSANTNRSALAAKHLRVPGVTVKQLQHALAQAGCNPGKVDGVMGQRTISAIKQFQQSYGLKADGICGKNTWAWLQNVTATAGSGIPPK